MDTSDLFMIRGRLTRPGSCADMKGIEVIMSKTCMILSLASLVGVAACSAPSAPAPTNQRGSAILNGYRRSRLGCGRRSRRGSTWAGLRRLVLHGGACLLAVGPHLGFLPGDEPARPEDHLLLCRNGCEPCLDERTGYGHVVPRRYLLSPSDIRRPSRNQRRGACASCQACVRHHLC